MIIARLASAIRHQHWSQIITEILIVVIGIFLGLQVQAWYDGRVARIEETRIVGYLVADMENTIAYLENKLERDNIKLTDGYHVISVLEKGELLASDVAQFEEGLRDVGKVGSAEGFMTSFTDDNFSQLLNNDLKRTINAYIGKKNTIEGIYNTNVFPTITSTLPKLFERTAVTDRWALQETIIYDFDTLKDDIEYRILFANILGRHEIIRESSQEFLQNSVEMLEVIKAYQKDRTVIETSFNTKLGILLK